MYSLPIVVFTLAIGLAYALPPFEIRSAGSAKTEAALDWMHHLQQHRLKQACNPAEGRIMCPSSSSFSDCVTWDQLCDGQSDCPREEDEASAMCYFLKARARSQRYGSF